MEIKVREIQFALIDHPEAGLQLYRHQALVLDELRGIRLD